MLRHSETGATSALIAALALVIVVFFAFGSTVIWLLGGQREEQAATDAGSLGVARDALVLPAITLNSGTEANNFGAYAQANGGVNLLAYNRLVGQTLIVAMNAQTEQTKAATSNATSLINALTIGGSCINQRLHDAINTFCQPAQGNSFANLAMANSTRMLGKFGNDNMQQVSNAGPALVAYTGAGSPTNVYLDPTMLPSGANLPAGTMNSGSVSSSAGQQYINGYTGVVVNIPNFGSLPPISGVAVNPQQQPHLLSATTFQNSVANPVSGIATMPPNTFLSAAQVQVGATNNLRANSYGVVGALQTDYPASIPQGFIVVSNDWVNYNLSPPSAVLPGYDNTTGSPAPSPDSIFNNQLYTGIYVANNGCFSTDESLINAWIAYNDSQKPGMPKVGTQPPITDPDSGEPTLFNISGAPVSGEQNGITALGLNGQIGLSFANYLNVQAGPNMIQALANMLPAFEAAYPSPSVDGSNTAQLTAVEQLNAEVTTMFAQGNPGQPAQPANTGMRIYPNGVNASYSVPKGGSPQITTPGTIYQLLGQADGTGKGRAAILTQLMQRMKEMKPSATTDEMNAVLGVPVSGQPLTANTIDLGQTCYIWLEQTSPTVSTFRMTSDPPAWLSNPPAIPAPADGQVTTLSNTFPTIGTIVDVIGEYGFNGNMFAAYPYSSTYDLGTDSASWTPSTGFNNLLGTLTFGESVGDNAATTSCMTAGVTNSINNYISSTAFDYNVIGQAEHDGNNIWGWPPLPYPQYSFATSTAAIVSLGQGQIQAANISYTINPPGGAAFTVVTTIQQANTTCLAKTFSVQN